MAVKRVLNMDQTAINHMLQGSGGDVNLMMQRFNRLAADSVREVANQRVTRRTGNYLKSIKSVEKTPTKLEVGSDSPYAMVLEKGSRPHQIVPRRAKVLAFEVGGRMVFSRYVRHPGTKAYHIVEDGVKRAGTRLRELHRV